jgi:hypothetical protein
VSGREGPNCRLYSADRVVVLFPHLGDAMLSLGGTLARLARLGVPAEILTLERSRPRCGGPSGGRRLHHPTGAEPRQVPVPALAPDERLGER